MDTTKSPSVTVRSLKALLALAERHELSVLEFNGVRIERGGPPRKQQTRVEAPTQLSAVPSDDYPSTVEELDAQIKRAFGDTLGA